MEEQMSKKISKSSNQHIPEEVIVEIFSKLPVKSLCRFKTVSKFLYSSIKDPAFVDRCRPKTLIQLAGMLDIVLDPDLDLFTVNQNGVATHTKSFSFRGEVFDGKLVNGLFCYHNAKCQLLLFNPTTGTLITLPKWTSFFDLGFIPDSNQYKVLGWDSDKEDCAFKVLTLEKDPYWRPVFHTGLSMYLRKYPATNVNGTLFWFDKIKKHVVSFNLVSEEFKVVVLPVEINNSQEFQYSLFEFEGVLCLVEQPACGTSRCHLEIVNLWMLKDVAKNMWVSMLNNLVFPLEGTFLNEMYINEDDHCALVCGSSGEIVTLAADETYAYIYAYNFLNGQFRRIELHGMPYRNMARVKTHVQNFTDLKQFVSRGARARQVVSGCAHDRARKWF